MWNVEPLEQQDIKGSWAGMMVVFDMEKEDLVDRPDYADSGHCYAATGGVGYCKVVNYDPNLLQLVIWKKEKLDM